VPNLFEKARDWLPAAVQAAAGVSVTYARGVTSLAITAVVGRTAFASNQMGGPRIEWGDRDYLITVEDLTIGEPAIGDRVTEVIDGTSIVFELVTPDTGEPAWRYSDPQRTVYRLHMKRVS
jgi:hypothetical protein